ncbi:hypothetical protein [Acaryochloris marina]|uniref:Rad52/22 double-strand break repair protein n=1 Tax=Acaryochloris marina (strain MBIC 11017) TaxID=329726 RepID=A8ZP70_ACAM1|nr:hypothetical protein [Acaryochloris marina]ABW32806.1 conserved hypothetical protein [Acaryochloris marina MBIC11017]
MQDRKILSLSRSTTQAVTPSQSQTNTPRAFRRPLEEILEDLRRPIPGRFIKTKSKKGVALRFVSWYDIVRILEARAPGFEYDCSPHFGDGKTVVKATITIHGEDGSLSRSALGIADSDIESWGDATSNASSMALRRAAAEFGLGLHLYWEK